MESEEGGGEEGAWGGGGVGEGCGVEEERVYEREFFFPVLIGLLAVVKKGFWMQEMGS